jgi:rubrerythrin
MILYFPNKKNVTFETLNTIKMENSKTVEILKTAILMEKRGQALYRTVAEQTQIEEVKNIFNLMAQEEQLHSEFLAKQLSEHARNQTLATLDLPAENDHSLVNMLLNKDLKKKIAAAGFEAAAISAAIDMENNAIRIYGERAEAATDPNEKALFVWLSDWEKGHHKLLSQLDNELKEQVWYDNNFWPF